MRAGPKREFGHDTSHLGHKYKLNTHKNIMVNGKGEGGRRSEREGENI